MLLTQGPRTGIYTILDFSRYPLLASTLLDNYRATNLVNSKDLLEPRLFIKAMTNEYVKASSSSLLILEYRTQVIRNTLNKVSSLATTDLILKDIVVIKGFYVNIILEAYLYMLGV